MEEVKETGGITGSTLKIIAIVTMFIDHVGAALFEHYQYKFLEPMGAEFCKEAITSKIPWLWADWMGDPAAVQNIDMILRAIGRIAFPIFCFLLVEGFLHTRDVKKYLTRLFIFALVSDVPFDLAFFGEIGLNHQNVFFTLLLGVLALACIDYVKKKDYQTFTGAYTFIGKAGIVVAAVLGALASITSMVSIIGYILYAVFGINEYIPNLIIGVVVGVVVYYIVSSKYDEEKKTRLGVYLFITLFFFVLAEVMSTDYAGWGVLAIIAIYAFKNARNNGFVWGVAALSIMSFGEAVAFLDLIPVHYYNGKRGLKMKYFFYAFYPAHLLLLFLLRYWIFKA